MKSRLMRVLAAATLLFLSGTAAAQTLNTTSCSDNLVPSSSGLSGSVSCSLVCSDGSGGTVTSTATFSGTYTGTLTVNGTGNCTGSGSWTKSGVYQGYAWTCSGSGSGTPYTGTCTVTPGGVGGVTSASGAQQQLQATVVQQVSAISGAVGSRMLSGVAGPPSSKQAASGSGMAAGNQADQWNAWTSLSKNEARYSPSESGKKRAMAITNFVVGADYQLNSGTILGLSAAFDRGGGSVTAGATGTSTEGYSLAPYLGLQLGSNLALDLAVGLGKGIVRQAGGFEAKSDRQFLATNLGYGQWIGNLQLAGKAGYLTSQDRYGDSTTNGEVMAGSATKNKIQQLNLGVEAGYWLDGMMPYVGMAYTRDVRMKTAVIDNTWDRDAVVVKAGVNLFSLANKVTGGIAYTEEVGRHNAKNATLMGNINVKF